jgi:hypothetical protein
MTCATRMSQLACPARKRVCSSGWRRLWRRRRPPTVDNHRCIGGCTRSSTMRAWPAFGLVDWMVVKFYELCITGACTLPVFLVSPHNNDLADRPGPLCVHLSRLYFCLTNQHSQVNYFGLVRCCKAFLLIFRRQMYHLSDREIRNRHWTVVVASST